MLRTEAPERTEPSSARSAGALAAVLVAAVALRVWVLATPLGALHGDEAVVGLMARRLLEGEFRTFYWGQDYGGSLEAVLAAVLFAVFGASTAALKAVPLVLDAAAGVLVWRVGRRMVGEAPARVAAAAFLLGPAGCVWLSTTSRGFYFSTLVLGLLVLLAALRIRDGDAVRRRDWLLLGAAGGLGWWQSPQVLYFAIPAALILVRRPSPLSRGSWPALAGALAGAAPWIAANVRNGFVSLQAPGQPVEAGYLDHLRVFFDEALPVALGLHADGRYRVAVLFPLLEVALVAFLAVRFSRGARPHALLGLALLAYPFVFALFPFSWTVGEGRYVLFLVPLVGLAIAHAATHPVARSAYPVAVLVLSATTIPLIDGRSSPGAPDVPVPRETGSLRQALEREGVDRAFADYFVAYRVTFETAEDVLVTPVERSRYQPYDDEVRASERPAWILVAGTGVEGPFRRRLGELGVAARRVEAGRFVLYLPDGRVVPEELAPETWRP